MLISPAGFRRHFDWTLLGLLAIALLIRVAVIVALPSIHHPDESLQIFEQAHRIAFGYGVVPWEFVVGIRNSILPFLFAIVFRIAEPIFGGPEGYLISAKVLLALWSLVAVAVAYLMGLKTSKRHAIIAGAAAAFWFDLIYFAGRPLTEPIAAPLLVVSLYLASAPEEAPGKKRLMVLGLCLGTCLMLRLQMLSGLAVLALLVGRQHIRSRWLPMLMGALVPALTFGSVDWLVWGQPFHTYIESIRVNLLGEVASEFGRSPARWYLTTLWDYWYLALPCIVVLAAVRWQKSSVWILVPMAIIAGHMPIWHKEYRFIFPALPCLIIIAALGSADVVQFLETRFARLRRHSLTAVTSLIWVLVSALLATRGPFVQEWYSDRGAVLASLSSAHRPNVCGVLFYNTRWSYVTGYTFLHRNVPIYGFAPIVAPSGFDYRASLMLRSARSFNTIILPRSFTPVFASNYRVERCFSEGQDEDVCLMARPGDCQTEEKLDALLAIGVPSSTRSKISGETAALGDSELGARLGFTYPTIEYAVQEVVCRYITCAKAPMTIRKSGNDILIISPYSDAATFTYFGTITGTHIAGWSPAGPWTADTK